VVSDFALHREGFDGMSNLTFTSKESPQVPSIAYVDDDGRLRYVQPSGELLRNFIKAFYSLADEEFFNLNPGCRKVEKDNL
jgi:hypothetical protein